MVPYDMEIVFVHKLPNKMCSLAIESLAMKKLKLNNHHHRGEWFWYSFDAITTLKACAEKYSWDELMGYSATQESLKDLGALFSGWGHGYRASKAEIYLRDKGMPRAAKFVSRINGRSINSSLCFPEYGADYALLEFMYETDGERAIKLADQES